MARHASFLIGTGCALLATPLCAQVTSIAPQPPAGSGEGQKDRVEEIIVTARRVTERAQDVPISVSVLSQDQLAVGRLPTVESLSGAVPNVKVFKTVGNSDAFAIYIRGLGRDNGGFNVEAPVAFYVDDVVYPYQVGPVVNVGDVARVEALRGPQGTLYGRNATVGALKYYTVRPDLYTFDFNGSVTGGSYGRFETVGGVNLPVVEEKLAVRFSGAYHGFGGFYDDQRTGRKLGGTRDFSGRASVKWEPTDDLDIFLSLDGLHDRDEPQPITSYIVASPTSAFPRFGDALNIETTATDPQINRLDVVGGTAQAAWSFDHLTLKSITGYRWFNQKYDVDLVGRQAVTFSGSVTDVHNKTFSQEFQATGDLFDRRLSYVAGVFYLNSPTHADSVTPFGAGTPTYFTFQRAKTVAGFFDATLDLFGGLSASAGVRVGRDSKRVSQKVVRTTGTFAAAGSTHWNSTTPRVSLNYKLNPNFLAYASYSKGFEAGALSTTQPTVLGAAAVFLPPQKINNKEVGLKTQWFGNRLTFNIDYFWAKYIAQTTAVLTPQLTTLLVATNQTAKGVEIDFRARPVRDWSIAGTLGTLRGKYVDIDPANTSISTLADKTPKHNPRLTYNLSSNYTFHGLIAEGDAIVLGAGVNHTSSTFECINHNIVCVSPAYTLLDLNGSYRFPDGRTELLVSGTNVTDKKYFKVSATGLGNFFAAPAEVSVTLRYKLR